MILKRGVSIEGCRAEILIAAISKIAPLFSEFCQPCVITSATEKYKHSAERSAHYRGDALDFRTRFFSSEEKAVFLIEVRKKLGKDFVCIMESTHLHIHWSPVYHD